MTFSYESNLSGVNMRGELIRMIVLVLSALCSVAATGRVVVNPPFEARRSSVLTVEKVELDPSATRVRFHAVFRPHWWITVDSTECITDAATGQEFYPVGSEGISFGEKCWMPASGDTVFTIIYPPMPENVNAIHYSPDGKFATWGIRLDGSAIEKGAESNRPDIAAGEYVGQPSFFTGGTTRLYGAIKNFDPRLDIENMALYIYDLASGDSYVKSVAVAPDGTFDDTFEISSPQTTMLSIGGSLIVVYLEPGNDLQILTDWEKILEQDRMRGLNPRIEDVEFGGTLGEINRVLYNSPYWESGDMAAMAQSGDPQAAMSDVDNRIAAYRAENDRYVEENNLSPRLRDFLNRRIQAFEAKDLLDFTMYRRHFRDSDPENEAYKTPLDREYYDNFLPDLLKADTLLLEADMMWVVLNRLGFGVMEDVLGMSDTVSSGADLYDSAEMARAIAEYAGTDDVPFLWQITLAARKGSAIKHNARWHKDRYRQSLDSVLTNLIHDPYLAGRLNDLYENTVTLNPYPLPDNDAGRAMSELLAPHKGKWVIADFWATTCGPCRANIMQGKAFRDANRGNKDFTYLFVTGDSESPRADYESFVAQYLADDNCAYLKGSIIIGVRDIFGISAIPHYVLFDPEGRVYDPSFLIRQTPAFLQQTGIEFVSPKPLQSK